MNIKLSIITINYNNATDLVRTIQSVKEQVWQDFEFLIIDGGSTDESINIIKANEEVIDYWISEKDRGVYHAMNKGILKAKGEYLFMLNSGDVLANPDVLSYIFFVNNFEEDILYGNIRWENEGQLHSIRDFPEELTYDFFWQGSLGHQSAFIKKKVHDIVGLYDESLKICSDWKLFLLSFASESLEFNYLPYTIAIGSIDGLSWDPTNYYQIKKEKEATIQLFFPEKLTEFKNSQKRNKPSLLDQLRISKKLILKFIHKKIK